uniref:WASH complex subunit 7 n=1 Tax=Cacopsylla melanoneura TaxID=428564 RepID=A0A8D8VB21_9HEMI
MWESEDKSLQDSTNIILGENQLQKYGKFLFSYTSKLNQLEDTHFEYHDVRNSPVRIKLIYHDENMNAEDQKENILNLVNTDNVIYNKIIIIFTHLNKEINFIVNELKSKYYNLLLYYGEQDSNESIAPETQIGNILSQIQDLLNLVKYAYKIFNETLKQLNSIYYFQWNNKVVGDNNICLYDVFLSLSELLMSFATLDEIVANQALFNEHWNVYKQAVICQIQTNSLGLDMKKLKILHKMMNDIEKVLLSGNLFNNAMQTKFNELKTNHKLSTSILNYIKLNMIKFENKQLSDLTYHKCLHFVKVCMLYVFHINTYGMNDKKLFIKAWECFKKFTSVTIYCNIVWFPDVFFEQHVTINIANIIDKRNVNAIRSIRDSYILQAHENIFKEVNIYNIYILTWIIKFDQLIKKDISYMRMNEIKQIVNILHDGIILSGKIKRILINITNLYYTLNKPIVKNNVIFICKLAESLKLMEQSFEENFVHICKIFNKIISFQQYQCLSLLGNIKKNINTNKNVELLTSLVLVEKLLKGSCSHDKLLIIKHSFAFMNKILLKEDEFNNLNKCVSQLSLSYNLENIMADNCNLSFLYFHKNLINIYIRNNGCHNLNIRYISNIMNDVCDVNTKEKDVFLNEIHTHIIEPLCTSIETNLRLHSHLHLQVEKLTLDKVENNLNRIFLQNPELFLVLNEYLDIKYKIENYLDKTFYDLTTIALHNYKTYNEMRNIAKYKFELNVIENNLPSKTLDNGIDILFLIRNINSFINNYNYNINNQVFIENKSNNKFLNTITISHIANNIRIYGIGIINTLINYIYQYLCKKLNTLIKYLYNENIKSKLIKEIKFYRENKLKLGQKYPFDRAEKLLKALKSIQEDPDPTDAELGHLNYAERFRVVITQVGNAIGLIRMIRSGSLHYCANSVQFVPPQSPPTCSDAEEDEDPSLSANTRHCLDTFDTVLKKSIHNLHESTDYFKLIINVFKPLLANTSIKHAYIVIPALIYHYVQYIIKIKEKVNKIKTSNFAIGAQEILNFTDDGFILGLSYLIKIFNINALYNSLDFYASIGEKYKIHQDGGAAGGAGSGGGKSVVVNNVDSLTQKTSQVYLNEFLLFYYNLNSVHVFFDQY